MPSDTNCSIWDYKDNLRFDEPLEPDSELLVDLRTCRGDYSRKRMIRQLGVNTQSGELRSTRRSQYLLFGGHRGCGKSTELRQIAAELNDRNRFFVVFIDAVKSLDVNNLRYSDVLLAQGRALAEELQEHGIIVPQAYLSPLANWFAERVKTMESTRSLAAELKTGAKAEGGVPLLFKLFGELTTAIRTGTTYKEEVREAVRNHFSELADAFNALVGFVTDEVSKRGLGKAVLFVIDGTDRLQRDEAETFFIDDIHQLRLVRANFVYCAPITILAEQGQARQNFDDVFQLPMIKLRDKESREKSDLGWGCLREFLLKRLPRHCFASDEAVDVLVEYSGGHPRDLLRLANYCLQELDEGPIPVQVAETAVRRLSNEYRRLVEPKDYELLAEVDRAEESYTPVGEQSRRLLYDLVLLEYNSYWWQTHPAVQTLRGYAEALEKLKPPR